jgi:NhaA family Na+:H+ antiporter
MKPTLPYPNAPSLPEDPGDSVLEAADQFIRTESYGGAVLIFATLATLIIANIPSTSGILAVFDMQAGIHLGSWSITHPIRQWINDGLLTIFFFVVGLEIKRELATGELSAPGALKLPLLAAVGGMLAPAMIYWFLLKDTDAVGGWGIVVATDIAFVVGSLALFGQRLPDNLRILLIAIAIFDDIGAVLVIAIGYGHGFEIFPFLLSLLLFGLAYAMQWAGIRTVTPYWMVGFFCWFALHESGIHPTLAGVALGLLTPARPWVGKTLLQKFIRWGDQRISEMPEQDFYHPQKAAIKLRLARAARESICPLIRLEYVLHPVSAFVVLPIFAIANAGISINLSAITSPVAIAIIIALVVGKPLGILLFVKLASLTGIARLPDNIDWATFGSASCLMGIGFTMSLFIATQAFTGPTLAAAKIGILLASLLAALVGAILLTMRFRRRV